MFTITSPDGDTVHTTEELGCARFMADSYGLGYQIADEAGVVIYIVSAASLADDLFDMFSE